MVLTETALLLTTYPGSLIYHLMMALTIALLFGFSQAALARNRTSRAVRWSLVGGILLALRLALMLVSALTELLVLDANLILPPLERFGSIASLVLVAWVFLFPQSNRRADMIASGVMVGIVAGLGMALAVSLLRPSLSYNETWPHLAWVIAGLGITMAIAGLHLRLHSSQWEISLAGFVLLYAGFALELGYRHTPGSLPGFLRLAEFAAYPLLDLAAFRALLMEVAPQVGEQAAPSAAARAAEFGPSAHEIISELGGLLSASRLVDFAHATVKSIARAMRSEICLLLSPPDPTGGFVISAGYDRIRDQLIPSIPMSGAQGPAIVSGLGGSQGVILTPQAHAADLESLRTVLNLEAAGPALMVPLISGVEAQGGLLLLSPYARSQWPPEDLRTLESVAPHLAIRLAEIRRYQAPGQEAQKEREALVAAHRRIQALEEEKTEILQELAGAREVSQRQETGDLAALLARYGEAQETIRHLEDEITTLKTSSAGLITARRSSETEKLEAQLQLALQELAEAKARLQFAEEDKAPPPQVAATAAADFKAVASIAQDLRGPLASVMGYTNLLLGESIGLLGAMQRRFLERVRDAIDRMTILLNKLIETAAFDIEAISGTSGPADMAECIEEAVTQTSSALREKNLALRLDLPEDIASVQGDQEAIIQILIHLIDNAIAASPENSEVVVAARLQETDGAGFLILSVSDAGVGIPPEELGHVFQRVYRADSPAIQGVGEDTSGLSVVKALGDAIGGRVWVDSEVGVGSTFTVLLPLADQPVAPVADSVEVM